MTDFSAVAYRTMGPRALLLGSNGDSLNGINTTPLPDGASCFVLENRSNYRLNKTSVLAPSPPTIIAPVVGEGRWFQDQSGGGGVEVQSALVLNQVSIDVIQAYTPIIIDAPGTTPLRIEFTNLEAGEQIVLSLQVIGRVSGFGSGIRITQSTGGAFSAIPNAESVDTTGSILGHYLFGFVFDVVAPTALLRFQGEWQAFGDQGTWTISPDTAPTQEKGTAILTGLRPLG